MYYNIHSCISYMCFTMFMYYHVMCTFMCVDTCACVLWHECRGQKTALGICLCCLPGLPLYAVEQDEWNVGFQGLFCFYLPSLHRSTGTKDAQMLTLCRLWGPQTQVFKFTWQVPPPSHFPSLFH